LEADIKEQDDLVLSFKENVTMYQLTHNHSHFSRPDFYQRFGEYKKALSRLNDLEETLKHFQRKLEGATYNITTESMVNEIKEGIPDPAVLDIRQNLQDMGGTMPEVTDAGISTYLRMGQDEDLSISEFFSRPVEIDSFNWNVGDPFFVTYQLWDLYTLNPAVRAKLRNYAYLSGDLHVRIVVSGSPFHFGKFLCSYQPYPQRNINIVNYNATMVVDPTSCRPLYINYLSQAAGAIVGDVKNNKPIDMICPFISTKNMFRLYNSSPLQIAPTTSYEDCEYAGALFLVSINDLSIESSTSIDVAFQLYVWLENVELGCTTATQVGITTESDERVVGPVQRVASSMAHVMGVLQQIPFIRSFAMPSVDLFNGISGVASLFGWSKPTVIVEPIYVKNEPFRCGAQCGGGETLKKISVDPRQELTVDPRIVGVDHDELVITNISSIKSYLTTFDWTVADARLTFPIWTCLVTPQLTTNYADETNRFFQPTAMAFAAAPFEYWHGTIRYHFEIVCSNFHRGKLAIYYEPNLAQVDIISVDIALNKNFMQIIDIQQTQDVEICVEWAQPRAWQMVQSAGLLGDYYASNEDTFAPTGLSYLYGNGFIGVVPFTELTGPVGNPVHVNVYVSCEDLMVQVPDSTNLPFARLFNSALGVEEKFDDVWTESAEYHSEKSDIQIPCYILNNTNVNMNGASMHHFGELPLSFRTLLKRYVTTLTGSATAWVSGMFTVNHKGVILPVAYPIYGSTITGSDPVMPHLFGYLQYAFLGIRGSVRKRIHVNVHGDNQSNNEFLNNFGAINRVSVTLAPVDTFSGNSVGWTAKDVKCDLRGSVSFVPHTNGGVEFEIPFYSNNMFAFAFASDFVGSNNAVNDMITTWIHHYNIDFEMSGGVATGITYEVIIETAAGEDFNYLRYSGAPRYSSPLV